MSRAAQLAVPALTFLVVAFAVLVAGVARPVRGARVYGGPTEGVARLSLRIVSIERDGESERAVWNGPLRVRGVPLSESASPSEQQVARATGGVSEVTLPFAHPLRGPVALEIHDSSGVLLAAGDIALGPERWLKRARRRGGWIRGRASGEFVVSVAPARGTFVIGSVDGLWIRVERSGQPAGAMALSISADGARIVSELPRFTDRQGRARLELEPNGLNPSIRVEAFAEGVPVALIETALPIVPGGLHAQVTPAGLRIESAVPRSEAFYSIISEAGRTAGGVLSLTPNASGGSFTVLPLGPRPIPSWIVVSGDADQSGASAIGWPLDSGTEPSQTLDVPDALLLDGLPAAFEREAVRRSRVRWLSALFIALAFALSVLLLVVRVRAADRDITRHLRSGLDDELVARVAPRRLLPLLVGVCAMGLAFIVVALVLLSRAR